MSIQFCIQVDLNRVYNVVTKFLNDITTRFEMHKTHFFENLIEILKNNAFLTILLDVC